MTNPDIAVESTPDGHKLSREELAHSESISLVLACVSIDAKLITGSQARGPSPTNAASRLRRRLSA
jgi:hypothetical protein